MSYCKDRVAVVTGAGGTLCSVIAAHLAEQGAKVVLVGRTREKLVKVADEIAASGGVCRIEPADVTDEAAVRDMAERIASEWGPCRLLINGAGGNNVKAMPTRLRFSEKDLCASAPLREKISQTAQAILEARAKYPDASLADLYDPLTMPPDLRAAHAANDHAVLAAYGLAPDTPEPEIVAHLFKLYDACVNRGKEVS